MTDVRTTDQGETEYTQPRKDAALEGGQAKCSRIEIEPTKNGGFSVRKYYRSQPSTGDGPSPYMEPDTYAFGTFADLSAFLATAFGEPAGDDGVTESAVPPPAAAAA